jgi:probable HAF family extracellular repeat protein
MRTSGQGDVVVGMANLVPSSVEFRIFRWTAATGIQDLGATFAAAPVSISTDGTTMAASLASSGPVRWTAGQGFTPISVPPFANPYDISGDGSVVVANDLGLVYTAYRWTAIGGAVAFPGLGGCSNDRIANSISSSGAITVGYSSYRSQPGRPGGCPPMAVRWNGTTIQELRFLPNGFRSVARDVSADGSVVVGWSNTTGNVVVGFIWKSATNRMQDLNQVLAGVPGAASWLVTDAIAVSGDGNVIAAIALNRNTGTFESVRIVLGGTTAPPGAITPTSLALNPATVTGGVSSTATVTLSGAAVPGGVTVSLASSNSAVATVPASVVVPAGASSASFTVTTSTVGTNSSAVISATLNNASASATLTVTPASPPPTLPPPSLISPAADARFAPGTNITFDWSDVAAATSYTIQIDDRDTFPSPFIVNQTVAVSQFSSNTLPTLTMWWRVRANNGGGSGPWSAARRFEVRN